MTSHTLHRGKSAVYVGPEPHDMGVKVTVDGRTYHPEYRPKALVFNYHMEGPPEYWEWIDQHLFFDKVAASDYQVTTEVRT